MKASKTLLVITIVLGVSLPSKENKLFVKKNNQSFFIANKGQWSKDVKYLARLNNMNAWITDSGVVYDYYKLTGDSNDNKLSETPLFEKDKFEPENVSAKGQIVKTLFNNKSLNQSFIGKGEKQTYYNYFIGNDKSKWASSIPLYETVTVNEIYNGIDIKYYFDNNSLRYDYIVKPGADISQINIGFEGTDGLIVTEKGELEIETSIGKVKHQNIFAYQGNKQVECTFTKRNNNTIGFTTGNYDKNKELIIDPLVYSTFLGGSQSDYGTSIAVDTNGNAYVTGQTGSSNYPTTIGAYDTSYNAQDEVFVTKLNSEGSNLIYSTFIGGSGGEIGNSIKLNENGEAFVAGWTTSADFPTTTGAYDESHNGGVDAFVLKLNSTGTRLLYSTLIGGSGGDGAQSLGIDKNGNAFITGKTTSANYPVTNGAYDQSYNGGFDLFVTKLNSTGTGLIYSTYLGGNLDDFGFAITVDINGNAYVTGWTFSADYPTTNSAYDKNQHGDSDVLLTKISPDGTTLVYSTFLGGNHKDTGLALAVDISGNAFITGYTFSSNYPVTSGAYDVNYHDDEDIFVTKINYDGSGLIYSTFIGGNTSDAAYSILIDLQGNAIITGNSLSRDFPITVDAYSQTNNGGLDVILTIINAGGNNLIYSTYLGGGGADQGYSITMNKNNNIFIVGYTWPMQSSFYYPTTIGAYDETPNGLFDVFVTKFSNLITSIDDGNNTNILPKEMSLEQNYPNPFNPETIISYTIGTSHLSVLRFVTLTVFDLLGREIATLVNEEKSAGTYTVKFNSSNLPSGIYFYRLKVGSFSQTKKMVILR